MLNGCIQAQDTNSTAADVLVFCPFNHFLGSRGVSMACCRKLVGNSSRVHFTKDINERIHPEFNYDFFFPPSVLLDHSTHQMALLYKHLLEERAFHCQNTFHTIFINRYCFPFGK